MKCSNCGAEIKEGEKFCKKCGQAINDTIEVQSNNSKPKKTNIGLIIGIVVLSLIALFAVIMVIAGKDTEKNPVEPETTVNENDNDEKNSQVKTPTQIEFNGYNFTVPADVTASVSNNQLFVYGPGSKWVGVVMTQESDYNILVSMKDQIKTALSAQESAENYDMTNAVTEEKEYGGKPFLVTKNIKSGTYNLDITYGKADDNNVYVVSITKSDGTDLTEAERTEMYELVASGEKQAQ